MSQTIDTPYNPHAEPSNFDGMWLRRTGWRCVRVRGLVLMVFVFVFVFVFCFDDRRSCRHVVNPKGRRRKDARLIQVIIK
jgi:succinate dehydrogenase hydrophobic anchor subunit